MSKVEQAQQALAAARQTQREAEHQYLVALANLDRLRAALQDTMNPTEHYALQTKFAKGESALEIAKRQAEQVKETLFQAEEAFRRERDSVEHRTYRLQNVIPLELKRLEAAVEGEQFAVASAEGKLNSSENLLAHIEGFPSPARGQRQRVKLAYCGV